MTEIYMFSSASNYQKCIYNSVTSLPETDSSFEFSFMANVDLLITRKANTPTKTLEVHILSVVSAYKTFTLSTPTTISLNDNVEYLYFSALPNGDLLVIPEFLYIADMKLDILTAASRYQNLISFADIPLHEIDGERHWTLKRISNLVFAGGGVKGIAYLGALERLEERGLDLKNIKRVGGASAGAITGLLIGLSYNLQQARDILFNLDFNKFLDGNEETLNTFNKLVNLNFSKFMDDKDDSNLVLSNFKNLFKDFSGEVGFITDMIHKTIDDTKSWGSFSFLTFLIVGLGAGYLNIRLNKPLLRFFIPVIPATPFAVYLCYLHFGVYERNLKVPQIIDEASGIVKLFNNFKEPLLDNFGLFKGDVLENWFEDLIRKQIKNLTGFEIRYLTFARLHDYVKRGYPVKDLYFVGINTHTKETDIFSYETTPDMIISNAVRISMAIPGVFTPKKARVWVKNGKGEEATESSKLIC